MKWGDDTALGSGRGSRFCRSPAPLPAPTLPAPAPALAEPAAAAPAPALTPEGPAPAPAPAGLQDAGCLAVLIAEAGYIKIVVCQGITYAARAPFPHELSCECAAKFGANRANRNLCFILRNVMPITGTFIT